MKKADASGAPVAVIVGDEEAQAGEASIKALRESASSSRCRRNALRMRYRSVFGTVEKEMTRTISKNRNSSPPESLVEGPRRRDHFGTALALAAVAAWIGWTRYERRKPRRPPCCTTRCRRRRRASISRRRGRLRSDSGEFPRSATRRSAALVSANSSFKREI